MGDKINRRDGKLSFKRIMLVEDSDLDIFLFQNIMQRTCKGSSIYTFTETAQALSFLKSCPKDKLPEFIITDLHVPTKSDGLNFIDAFWQLEKDITSAILVAYTAHIKEDEIDLKELKGKKKSGTISGNQLQWTA